MTTPDNDRQRSLFASIIDPSDTIAAICIFMAGLHVALAFLPVRIAIQAWRLFEISPRAILAAFENGDAYSAARAFLGHIFFHVNAAHLLINITGILILGAVVYREMAARATVRKSDAPAAFIAFFLISGMAAAAAYVFASPDSGRPMIGASGAAAGLAGACVWIYVTRYRAGGARAGFSLNFLIIALTSVLLVVSSILLDTSPISHALFGSASAWQAHIGGYLFGVFAYPLFERLAGAGAAVR